MGVILCVHIRAVLEQNLDSFIGGFEETVTLFFYINLVLDRELRILSLT